MKITEKGKHLAKVTAVVTVINIALGVVTFAVTHPTAKHLDVARKMNAGPEERVFSDLMASPEANWTIFSGMVMALVQFIVYVAAIYLVYRYVRKQRLTPNAAGVTTGMFAVASTIALLVTTGIDYLLGMQTVLYESPAALIGLTLISLIVSFLITLLIVLVVEKIYDRKHSFAIE